MTALIHKFYSGGGVADSEDAVSIAINPAGLFDVGQQANLGLTFLTVWPEYSATRTGFIAPGSANSNKNFYPLPVAAYSQPLDADNAVGLAIYGNGGLGSTYNIYNSNTKSSGVFGGGPTGVEVLQVFISPDYAHRFGNFSIGIAPVISIQRFGLGPLRIQGLFRKSVERHQPGRQLERRRRPARRRAVDRGAGLPPRRRKHNAGRDVGLRELSGPVRPPLLGSIGGPGFGWRDVNVFTISGEWRVAPTFTLRAGYAYNTQPIPSTDIVFNILAPAVVQNHISAGFSYNFLPNQSIDFGAIFAPRQTVTGPVPTTLGGGSVTLSLWEFEATVGYTYKFGAPAAPVVAKY
ncbi:OmpP1/FadL family transporter [Methylocella sp.]|uniref:OmpP1/FadL family transporter n=1 Tax=Methylocella sp. TaxID=1978226 RepID=UPI003C241DAA